jgi:methylated-DNA-[protein]-cysteine S-methyltransferase
MILYHLYTNATFSSYVDKYYEIHPNHEDLNLDLIKGTKDSLHFSPRSQAKKANIIANKAIIHEDVYDLLRKIPAGKVSTYGDLAKALGNPSASRTIGRILGKNPNPIQVPCHRVVMSDGKLGGYMHGIEIKRELLKKEGISFMNEKTVCNFKNIRVYPQNSKSKVNN